MNEAFYHDIIGALRRSAALEKRAAAGDQDALRHKTAHDMATFQQVKEAVNWATLAPQLQKGLAVGTGAAIPVTAGGALLINQAGNEREEAIEDMRNKALQTALGVGGIGAGLMGLQHALAAQRSDHVQKQGADENELLEKLATVGYLDTLLLSQEKNAAHGQEARLCRHLNAEHGVSLLRQLLGE